MWDSEDQNSLEFIEDPYFNPQDSSSTPSLDELNTEDYLPEDDTSDIIDNELDLFDLRQLDFHNYNYDSSLDVNLHDESVSVEAGFYIVKRANDILRTFFRKNLKRQVRVTYCDLTKPYLVKLPKDHNFRKYLGITVNSEEAQVATEHMPKELEGLTPDEVQIQRQFWEDELAEIEDEIATLRTVLAVKIRRSGELKKNLGKTVWQELSDDMNQGLKHVKESNVYQTVETRVGQISKAVTDAPIYQKTTSLIGGITGNITNKIGQMRHSESFKSFEEKVGSAYENVKTKVSTSRSGSLHSLNNEMSRPYDPKPTSPTVVEEKPIA